MNKIRRLIWVALLLAVILAPLETTGVLRRGYGQLKTLAAGAEAQSLVSKFKIELPKLSSTILGLLSKLFPKLEVKVKEAH